MLVYIYNVDQKFIRDSLICFFLAEYFDLYLAKLLSRMQSVIDVIKQNSQ